MKKEKLVKVSVTAVFCALAFILTLMLKFKVAHLSFDFKDTILAVISLMYGPLYGVASSGIVVLLEFIAVNDTGPYGMIMNFISSATFVFTAGIIYKYKRTFSGAVLAVAFSVISVSIVMCLANIIITPLYITNMTSREVVAVIPTLLLPFNLSKSLINAAATLIIYKPIRNILKRSGIQQTKEVSNNRNFIKSVILCIISLVIIVITIIYIIKYLNGSFEVLL